MDTALSRSALKPSRRRALAGAAGLLTVGVVGLLAGAAAQRCRLQIPIAMPVVVQAPELPAPVVTVHVPPPPAPLAPPAPPAPPVPEPPPPPPPRALAPHLQAACITPRTDGAQMPAACAWDDGFPALSDDGTQFVKKLRDVQPFTEGLAIGFFDAATSRLVRQVVLLSADGDFEAEGQLRPGTEARVAQRVAALQRALDARGFHSLTALGASDIDLSEPSAAAAASKHIHAELDGAAARIVDPARAAVLWQHDFVSRAPARRPAADSADEMCGGKDLHRLAMWWDPATGVVLTELSFFTGGCMCPTLVEDQLHRVPAAALAGR